MQSFNHIAVIGSGSWGSALACQVARRRDLVKLFVRDSNVVNEIINQRTNIRYLKDLALPKNIQPTNQIQDLLNQQVIIIAVPSSTITDILLLLKKHDISQDIVLLIATKGIVNNPSELITERIKSLLPNPVALISGPNFAKEVVNGQYSTTTIASKNIALANKLACSLKTDNFVIDITDDIITIQIAGALKNIIAIKSGMYEAMGYGENARAALITQGIGEIKKLSVKLGGKIETLTSNAVIGDLVLTCYSKTSRNTRFGYDLASQSTDIKKFQYHYLVEGIESTKSILNFTAQYKIDLPIVKSIAQALKLE